MIRRILIKNLCCRHEDDRKGYSFLVESIWTTWFERDHFRWTAAAWYLAAHAARVQAAKLHTQFCVRSILGWTKGGRTPFSHYWASKWDTRVEKALGRILSQSSNSPWCYAFGTSLMSWLKFSGCVSSPKIDGQTHVFCQLHWDGSCYRRPI